ncbi:hypothetical protein MNBD_GAMMA11-1879 [hydrothermal vent metagenome]|uniref:Cytochrome c oxidase subunit CcoQ n=1 Tax=hydrothermal vent metagenome TaxID=652676 RepID=A0A3B0X7M7_9ZZZZ
MSDIFNTDWAAMTLNDWTGMFITLTVFFLMIWAYVYTFHPKNKEKLESQRHVIFDDDDNKVEDSEQ